MQISIERSSWRDALRCPGCGQGLSGPTGSGPDDALTCGSGHVHPIEAGIPSLLRARDRERHRRFLRHYRAVREREGYTRRSPAALTRLPEVEPDDPDAEIWRLRAASATVLERRVAAPMSAVRGRPLRILDLGAGTGWLASRLASAGHDLLALDLGADPTDGLGALAHLDGAVTALAASFDAIPLADGVADLAIWNASLHYAGDPARTVVEARRVIVPDGRMVVLDTPVYRDPTSGEAMLVERREAWRRRGLPDAPGEAIGYLTRDRLHALATGLGLVARCHRVEVGWRRRLRPLVARMLGRREPASMPVIELRCRDREGGWAPGARHRPR